MAKKSSLANFFDRLKGYFRLGWLQMPKNTDDLEDKFSPETGYCMIQTEEY
jgi:hypothetical protein